jgi:uncharacterized protein YcaQ
MLRADEARRIAVAAQGVGSAPAVARGRRDGAHPASMLAAVRRLGLLQIDSVNVLARAHYLPLFSRLGAYDREVLDGFANRAPRRLFEYWAHAACLVPVGLHPALRWRMAAAREEAWGGMRAVEATHPGLLDRVLDAVTEIGPATHSEIEATLGPRAARTKTEWGWNWSAAKRALELLFWAGEVTTAGRRGFERRYDLPARALPAAVVDAPTPEPAAAHRELVTVAARALGVATEPDLRDYFRLRPADSRAAVATLAEDGVLLPVAVEGWTAPAWLHRDAVLPRRVDARALLAPFDPLVFHRPRVERLFGFEYRIEIYVKAPDRVHGYYVLPFLSGETLTARVDLKADRVAGVLLVQAAWGEPGAPADTADELAVALGELAVWLGLDGVRVVDRGDLARPLAAATGS